MQETMPRIYRKVQAPFFVVYEYHHLDLGARSLVGATDGVRAGRLRPVR